jgi:hypothetical protein
MGCLWIVVAAITSSLLPAKFEPILASYEHDQEWLEFVREPDDAHKVPEFR